MPGRRKCEPGCECKKHSRWPNLTPEERKQRDRDRAREGMQRFRDRNRMSDEERLAAHERKKQLNRERAAELRAGDPDYVERQRERARIHGRRYAIKYKFGITLDEWDQILRNQSGRCFLCENPLQGGRTDIHIDHDHGCCSGKKTCGKCIRGLACQKCNQGVGQFGDDPNLMRRVAANLELANAALRASRTT